MLFKDSLGKCDLGMLRSSRPAGLGLPRAGRWPVPRRRSWPRSVPAEPDGPRPSPRLFSARVHSATRDGSATYLMATACRRRCISTILSSRSHRYHDRRPLSDRSAPTTPWPSRPRGRAHGRRKHEIGLGVRSTIPRDTPESAGRFTTEPLACTSYASPKAPFWASWACRHAVGWCRLATNGCGWTHYV